MFHGHGLPKSCYVLVVLCGEFVDGKEDDAKGFASYPFQKLVSSGRLEIHTLVNPSVDKFREVQELRNPNILYLQGEKLGSEGEIGSLVWAGVDISDPERLCSLIGPSLPTAIYLEFQNGENVAGALYSKGIPYVMYWKNGFSSYFASHFRHAFFSVVQSSCGHTWDAFQIAHASFRLYCVSNASDSPVKSQKVGGEVTPCILGEAPKFIIPPEGKNIDEEENSSYILPAISIYNVAVDMAFLICGVPYKLDARLGSLEDGLNTLLRIEIRGSKLHNRVSATPPPSLQAGGLSSGVVTMRCDITTCSSAHISLLVSGSPRILFDDQLLEAHIKNELTEKSQLVQALPISGENKLCLVRPRKSSSIACGASVFEVCMKIPIWAAQVLKQLAPDVSYRSLVALGIASIQGTSVSSFEKEDGERILFFCTEQENLDTLGCTLSPSWFRLPAPSRYSQAADEKMKPGSPDMTEIEAPNGIKGRKIPPVPVRQRLKVAAMRPIPHTRHHKMMPFSGTIEVNNNVDSHLKPTLPSLPSRKHMPAPVSRRKSVSNSQAQQMISLNPLPLEKHGCDRPPIRVCSEEEFLSDVMEFLILRGHSRLIPQGGISEFPDVILNAKRLDLYNLYREVVSRGGFHVGNGINWKGQVFSKMRNHTLTNRMTGVGNSLKRHYETYLLEYELAHDDVDGEFCLLCHSSAPGDWVNCGLCGEWAHFGCDRRQGLGAFKDYAKTDGLEYICPHCSATTGRRKSLKLGNGT